MGVFFGTTLGYGPKINEILFLFLLLLLLVNEIITYRYGGAVGLVGFDGHLNTGLTLRTVRVKDGMAEVRTYVRTVKL